MQTMHRPVSQRENSSEGINLHALPGIIGKLAPETDASTQVLSHFLARSLRNVKENLRVIQSRYDGSMVSANDLDCIN